MYLVKNIINAIQTSNYPQLSESEIKVLVKKAKRDYGTTNNCLRRLCQHGVLSRIAGVCKSSRRPSWLYQIIISDDAIVDYIARKEEQQAKYKNRMGELFYFGDEFGVSTSYAQSPVMIGNCLVDRPLRHKCLIVSGQYEMVTEKHEGRTIIYFKMKG